MQHFICEGKTKEGLLNTLTVFTFQEEQCLEEEGARTDVALEGVTEKKKQYFILIHCVFKKTAVAVQSIGAGGFEWEEADVGKEFKKQRQPGSQ